MIEPNRNDGFGSLASGRPLPRGDHRVLPCEVPLPARTREIDVPRLEEIPHGNFGKLLLSPDVLPCEQERRREIEDIRPMSERIILGRVLLPL